jgi:allantoinase
MNGSDGRADLQLAEVNQPEVIRRQIAELLADRGPAAETSPPPSPDREGLDVVVRGARIMTTAGVAAREIGIAGGTIARLEPLGAGLSAPTVIDLADDEVLIPGLVDAHVHVNEPGRTSWEGFATATKAAAAGGITTIVDMPLNSIPSTVNGPALELKQLVAAPQAFVDVGFWGGAVPGNLGHLRELHDAGVFGFKCFLSPSGVDEFPPLSWEQLDDVLARLSPLDALLIVHAEDPAELSEPTGASYADFLASRPPSAEDRAVDGLIARASRRLHVLHLSSANTLDRLARAGHRITAETCPHYLTLAAERVPPGGTEFKCCPPIRDENNRDRLWQGLADGVIDCVVSDHSPSTPALKRGGFDQAWGGVSSLQVGLPAVWTEARRRGHPLSDVVRWMATAPAELVGLARKGRIAPGCAADLVAFAPDEEFTVGELRHRHPVTPYAGARLRGVVHRTWLRGRVVDGEPTGVLLTREKTA